MEKFGHVVAMIRTLPHAAKSAGTGHCGGLEFCHQDSVNCVNLCPVWAGES